MKIKSLQNMISGFALSSPGKAAVEYEKKTFTYSEICQNSNCIANALDREFDSCKTILLFMDKGPFLIEAILGVMSFGGVFAPLDPHLPESRLRLMLEEVDTRCVISQTQHLSKLNKIAEAGNARLDVFIEGPVEPGLEERPFLNIHIIDFNMPEQRAMETARYNEACYIYFTSGSTGKPKGVLGKHSSLEHFIEWEMGQFGINESFRVSQLTTPSFDPFLRDIFVPLCSGATLCIPEEQEIILNPRRLIQWIDDKNISLIHMVPTLFKNMSRELEDSHCFYNLKYILLAGELLKGNDLKKFYGLFASRIQLVNLYGPTETTLAKAFYLIEEKDTYRINIPVGKPIKDTELYILDDQMKPCPQGSAGEIYIHTPFMSSGYFNDRELTDRVFLKSPFCGEPGSLVYKTGDLGVLLPGGDIECLGRLDNQVKIRGMRIELSEIETHILKNKAVREGVVIAREEEGGEKSLCAFLTGDEGLDIPAIRESLGKVLPDYMVPSYFARLDALPQLPNGKTDRKALLKYEAERVTGEEYRPPCNETEEKLLKLWQEVLRAERIGTNDNFFFMGGNSLKAAKLALRIHKEFEREIRVKDVFGNNTIKSQAEYLKSSGKSGFAPIPVAERREYYPASSAQKRIFLINMIENAGISYNMPEIWLIEGRPDRGLFDRAFRSLVERHDSLRTSFEVAGGEIVQRIHKAADFEMEYMEEAPVPGDAKADWEERVQEIAKDFIRPFDLGKAPLFRVRLVKLAQGRYALLRDMHHIISDGISEEILKGEFSRLCRGQELERLKIQYKDFSEWQRELNKSAHIREQENYWLEVFKGELPALNLPADFKRPPKQSFEGESITMEVPEQLARQIKRSAAENGATPYMFLLTAFHVLLSRYTGQGDIVIGSPVAGRRHADVEGVTGVFINTLALRNRSVPEMTFREFMAEVRETSLKAFENQDCQFENLIEKLKVTRDLSRNPLFDVMFIMQNMEFEAVNIDSLKIKKLKNRTHTSKFDITLTAVDMEDSFELTLEYCTALFKKETMERLGRHFGNILKSAAKNPDTRLSDIAMLSEEEREQLIRGFNNTAASYEAHKTVHQLFEERAGEFPDKPALVFGESRLTYWELNAKSNALAELLRSKGVKAGSIVGLLLPRSLEMLVGIMGILKAGGAYLPIDPEYPPDRIGYMLDDSGADMLLTGKKADGRGLPPGGERRAAVLELSLEELSPFEGPNPVSGAGPGSLAYVIYTSGSTGKPKGVMLEHRNIVNFIKGMSDKIDFSCEKTVLCLTTISFDIFVLETLLPLAKGLTVAIAHEREQLDPDLLSQLIAASKVDILQATPSRLQMLMHSPRAAACLQGLKELIVGGEALPEILLQDLRKLPNTKIYNVYGPTETAVWSTIKEIDGYESVTIGRPIANTQIYILDKFNNIQPVGVPGELHIGGDGLARGYLNRPGLTAEKFIPDPFDCGRRIYRTGDLARWLPCGEIEFLGRMDSQVKLRGYRIELPEIEKCIMEGFPVKNCVCAVRDDSHGSKYLAAYYTGEEALQVSEIRARLAKFLPDYMVPQSFTRLEHLPMTPNGKVDRKALPEPEKLRPKLESDYFEAQTDTEKKVAQVWENILNREAIGIYDNFFDLGGNSFLLVIMHDSLEKMFPGRVNVADMFANPTISKLARFISGEEASPQNIGIASLELPEEFFCGEYEDNERATPEYEIEGGMYRSLTEIAGENGVEPGSILLSAYAYLLAEVAGKEKIPVQTVLDEGRAVQLEVDLSGVEDFNSLFRTVSLALQRENKENSYPLKAYGRNRGQEERGSAVTAFAAAEGVSLEDSGCFDMLLKAVEGDERICVALEFNSSKIRYTKAEELFKWYIKILNLMIKKINQ